MASRSRSQTFLLILWASLTTGDLGCQDRRTPLGVTITAPDKFPAISRIVVVASSGDVHQASATASDPTGATLVLPVTIQLDLSSLPAGNASVKATAFDAAQKIVALGSGAILVPVSRAVTVELSCEDPTCTRKPTDAGVDGGTGEGDAHDADPDGAVTVNPTCGNGRLDRGETCDIARAPELPGACPPSCDDGIACTRDRRMGDQCTALCEHVEITDSVAGDGCCPAHGDHSTDSDCSPSCGNQRVDPGETCDTAIATGPGTCPDSPSCGDKDSCTKDFLLSEGTCSARCVHVPIQLVTDGDGCCPLGADATTDDDCPAACGNGIQEPGETCDVGTVSGPGACPTASTCDDGNSCTQDSVVGSGCSVTCVHTVIQAPIPDDGCCPVAGLSPNVDSDCPAICGNAILETGETCDKALAESAFGGCPSSCPAPPATCTQFVMQGSAAECTRACVLMPVAVCSSNADGCCPTGCTSATDPDCSPTCGNGQVDANELCDTAITSGAGACPLRCSDGISCTDDLLVDGGNCRARCIFVPTTTPRDGDGCCPPHADAAIDNDCPATCGNGIVETPWETCDTATNPASCSASCPPAETCTKWTRTTAGSCYAGCTEQVIKTCVNGDGCCGPGCNANNDSDCRPLCGNAVVEAPEACDSAITAGQPGACPTSCSDNDACTLDFAAGSAESCTRTCSHVAITACGGGDQCCPAGCTGETDSDCTPVCGDGQVQAKEACDPPASCPTNCPSDGDPCTVDQLVGSASICTARCAHIPILRCSGAQRDGCCPSVCDATSDSDC